MSDLVAGAVVLVYAFLALCHFYWAFGGGGGKLAVLPEVNGRRAFTPSLASTIAVAVALSAAAILVAASAGFIRLPVPAGILSWLMLVLAVVFLARAIGDFRLVGFFKRTRGTRFARLDTILFSPLCLALAAGVFFVALTHWA